MKKLIQEIKNRYQNVQFWLRIILISALPILAGLNVKIEQLSTWEEVLGVLSRFISNPYLIGFYIFTLVQSFTNSKSIKE
jgi:hypothetical protein